MEEIIYCPVCGKPSFVNHSIDNTNRYCQICENCNGKRGKEEDA